MEYKEFIKLVQHGASFPKDSIPLLQKFSSEFPYFQTAHALLAKAMHDHQDVRYDRQLKYASAYATDRKALHKLIHYRPTGVFAIAADESPFIHTEEVAEHKVVVPPSAPQIIHDFVPEEVSAAIPEPEITVQHPVIEDVSTPLPSDPQEILRRRLEEILGKPSEKNDSTVNQTEKPVVNDQAKKKEEHYTPVQETTTVVEQHKPISAPATEISTTVEEADSITNPVAVDSKLTEEIVPEEITSSSEEPVVEIQEEREVSEVNTSKENIEELISAESEKAVDPVQREQLEYALESAILDSLEKLPLIKKEETAVEKVNVAEVIAEKKEESNFNFIDWLKSKSNAGFGHVEVVHADDEPKGEEAELPVIEETRVELKEEIKADSSETKVPEKPADAEKAALIDKFIATEPRIVPSKQEFYSPPSQARKSVAEHEDLVSETLARIYYQQGNLLKARSAYEKLSLFYPEKKTYFAALINEIDAQFNNLNKQDL